MMLSYPAKAGYPVILELEKDPNNSEYWIIRFRG